MILCLRNSRAESEILQRKKNSNIQTSEYHFSMVQCTILFYSKRLQNDSQNKNIVVKLNKDAIKSGYRTLSIITNFIYFYCY